MTREEIRGKYEGKCTDLLEIHGETEEIFKDSYVFWLEDMLIKKRQYDRGFWKETAQLIVDFRRERDERAAQGVVDCRIIADKLSKEVEQY